jgi:type II secretory pathway pseudopilin PulG
MARFRPRSHPNDRVAGFTLIEALATLAVTGLTLSVMFSIGVKNIAAGYRLGHRAVDHANQQVSTGAVRDVLDSMVIPALAPASQGAEDEAETNDQNGMGDEFDGASDTLAGYIIAARDNPCLPTGGEGRITLSFKTDNGRTLLMCQVNAEDPVVLGNFGWPDAAFSYSEDGTTWTDTWQVIRAQTVDNAAVPDSEQREVYVRIASRDGANQVVELVQSGRRVTIAAQTPR